MVYRRLPFSLRTTDSRKRHGYVDVAHEVGDQGKTQADYHDDEQRSAPPSF